jgi:hypothetical protein
MGDVGNMIASLAGAAIWLVLYFIANGIKNSSTNDRVRGIAGGFAKVFGWLAVILVVGGLLSMCSGGGDGWETLPTRGNP